MVARRLYGRDDDADPDSEAKSFYFSFDKMFRSKGFFFHRPIGDSPFVKISNLISNSILASLRHIRHIHILVSCPTNKNHEDYHIICFQESKLSTSQILVFQWDAEKQQERHVVFGG